MPAPINLHNIGAEFVLKMLSEQKLNQVNVQFVMEVAKTLINQSVNHRMNQVASILTSNNIDPTCLAGLIGSSIDPFVSIHNQHGQNKYFARHFGTQF